MKHVYIVFYATAAGFGNTELTLTRRERPVNIEAIRKIEEAVSKDIGSNVSVTGFRKVGRKWK